MHSLIHADVVEVEEHLRKLRAREHTRRGKVRSIHAVHDAAQVAERHARSRPGSDAAAVRDLSQSRIDQIRAELHIGQRVEKGAGVIFGTTGGVMEAALRSVYEIYTGHPLQNVNFEQVRGLNGVRRATIDLNGFELKVGIAHGLGNARHLLEDIRNGHNKYHVIEIMACPGGCIGGGGQPLHHGNSEVLYARANALYREDAGKPIRKSHDNPYIKTLYEEYLGKPLSEKSEKLLHTHYFNKSID